MAPRMSQKKNLQDFISEQLYFKKERLVDMQETRITMEIGTGLLPIATGEDGISLIFEYKKIKKAHKEETGKELEMVRIKDNVDIPKMQFQVSVDGNIDYIDVLTMSDQRQQSDRIMDVLKKYVIPQ